MRYISDSPSKTKQLAKKFASNLGGGEVICLYGDLGAGKTTFITGIINYFLPGKRILSPTFIIVRHYEISRPAIKFIYHIDLYRISKENELVGLGINDLFNKPDSLVLIEWADRLGMLKPEDRIDIKFYNIGDLKRKIIVNNPMLRSKNF